MTIAPLKVAFTASHNAPVNSLRTMAWKEVSAMLSKPAISNSKAGEAWLPAEIEPGIRNSERVHTVSALVLDVEADTACDKETKIKTVVGVEPPPLDEFAAELALAGYAAILHTSYSHHDPAILPCDVGHNRYRSVFALSRPLATDEVRPLARHVAALFGLSDCVDASCMEPSRLFFLPRCPAERVELFQHEELDGVPLDVDALLRDARREADALDHAKAKSNTRGKNTVSVIDAFNATYTPGEIIEQHGYIPNRNRWMYANSTSGLPGVRLLPNSTPERIFSSHSNDPLADDHAHDAFDCFRILEHAGDFKTAVREAARILGMDTRKNDPVGSDSSSSNGDGDSRSWPELADPFADHVVPAFPLHVLPEAMRVFCIEKSAQSGFDVGGYSFSALITAGNLIDHRVKMNVGAFSVPAFLWATFNGNSGVGKSPILGEAAKPAREIDDETVKQSQREFANWRAQCLAAPKGMEPPKPVWRQRNALDTTTEALALILSDNPEGVNIHADELSEFIGRMDAYKAGSGADRAVYLRAYDGGQVTINRASKNTLVVNNFSVGILAGIQPEKLAQMFKKSGGGSDGLFQRFLTYSLRPAGQCDYNAQLGAFTEVNYGNLFRTLHGWTEAGTVTAASLCDEGRLLMQAYHNDIRKLTSRTPSQRFAEHLDKYPGFLGRMAFALHCIECAAVGEYQPTVSADTLRRAIAIMQVMYRHSEATYAVLDSESGDVLRLVVSAAEAVLTKGWHLFKRGDLTRNATYWQGADAGQAEGAIDFLIELGWLADVTPSAVPGKRGRRSDGVFQVNPLVHERFTDHATRVRQSRADRFSAIQQIAGNKLE